MEFIQDDNIITFDVSEDDVPTGLTTVLSEAKKHLTNPDNIAMIETLIDNIFASENMIETVAYFQVGCDCMRIEGHALEVAGPGQFKLSLEVEEPLTVTIQVMTRDDGQVVARASYSDGVVMDYKITLSDEDYNFLAAQGDHEVVGKRGGAYDNLHASVTDAANSNNVEIVEVQ